jgi:ketosteroid isomerase-like protein
VAIAIYRLLYVFFAVSLKGTEMDLQTLLDEREITQLLGRFARILDGRDWSSVEDVFAADITFNYGDGQEQAGVAALRDQFQRFLDPCGPSQHLLGSIMVTVTGDTAVSRAYIQARHQGAGTKAHLLYDSNGEYIDGWERRPEGWRMIRRDARWLMQKGDPSVLSA